MNFQINKGKIKRAQKIVLYGPEGIGKSTFGSYFEDALFIDTEGSTSHLDVRRYDRPTSFRTLMEMVKYTAKTKNCKTLVIDTIDWAENLCISYVCSMKGVNNIEDIGYGKGYTYLAEEFSKLLRLLESLTDIGINVLLLAHAQIRKFEKPDEMGAYDRWELKLQKKTAPLVKEWSDCLLFANYKTILVTDSRTNSKKAQGGARVIYTNHTPAWDAKNRYGMEDIMDFDPKKIIPYILEGQDEKELKEAEKKSDKDISKEKEEEKALGMEQDMEETYFYVNTDDFEIKEASYYFSEEDLKSSPLRRVDEERFRLFERLKEIMDKNGIGIRDIEDMVVSKGYYPRGTNICDYDKEFIRKVLLEEE